MKMFLPVFVYIMIIFGLFMESAMALQRLQWAISQITWRKAVRGPQIWRRMKFLQADCQSPRDPSIRHLKAECVNEIKHIYETMGYLTDYMEESCKTTIDMEEDEIPAGRLSVTKRTQYRNRLNCQVTIMAPKDKRLLIVFRDLAIEWEDTCDDDFVQLFDGRSLTAPMVQGLEQRLCGYNAPSGSYVTTGDSLTVFFQSDIFKQDNGFEIVFTAFHTSEHGCFNDEFRCDNGRCISSLLECNNFDNCGDSSDECKVSADVLMGIILSVFLLTVAAVGAIAIYKKNKKLAKRSKAVERKSIHNSCSGCGKALKTKTSNSTKRAIRKWKPLMAENSQYLWTTDMEAKPPYQPFPPESLTREATPEHPEKLAHGKRASV